MISSRKKRQRIDRRTIFADLEVQMRSRRAARAAHRADQISHRNFLAFFDVEFLHVRIESRPTVTRFNEDHSPEAPEVAASIDDRSASRGENGGVFRSGEVDPQVRTTFVRHKPARKAG